MGENLKGLRFSEILKECLVQSLKLARYLSELVPDCLADLTTGMSEYFQGLVLHLDNSDCGFPY